jgi:hypothetical protein
VFLQERGVVVTNARVVLPGETYAVALITSVRQETDDKGKTTALEFAVGSGILCLLTLVCGGFVLAAPLFFVIVICAVVAADIPVQHVVLVTSAHESRALSSPDQEFIKRVIQAINDAIVARGGPWRGLVRQANPRHQQAAEVLPEKVVAYTLIAAPALDPAADGSEGLLHTLVLFRQPPLSREAPGGPLPLLLAEGEQARDEVALEAAPQAFADEGRLEDGLQRRYDPREGLEPGRREVEVVFVVVVHGVTCPRTS